MNQNDSEMKQQVFFSYSPESTEFVTTLRKALKDLGHNIFTREEIRGGGQTFDIIHKALDRSEIMLLVITPHSMKSSHVQSEWTYFYGERRKRLIPILLTPLEPPERLNYMLASLQQIDFHTQPYDIALYSLHQTLLETYSEIREFGPKTLNNQVSQNFAVQEPVEWKGLLHPEQAGLNGIHLDFPTESFRNWLWSAKRNVSVLNTWTGVFVNFEEQLISSAKRGIALRILLLSIVIVC
jgi:hypothetical protein